MPDHHYYVSQQRGSDSNDGLSSAAPWATLAKANTTVTASADGETYIHIGPGTYRERLVLANAGIDATHRIIWQGDPEAVMVRGDRPGPVRITGADTNENPTAGTVVNWNGKQFVEFWNVRGDGTSDYYAFQMGSAIDLSVACRQCVGVGSSAGFRGGSCDRCVGEGGSAAFSSTYAVQCIGRGGHYAFQYCTTILCWGSGQRAYSYCTASCSLAASCPYGADHSTLLSCAILGCSIVNDLGVATLNTRSAALTWPDLLSLKSLPLRSELVRALRLGTIHNHNTSTAGATVSLSSERFYTFMPDEAGKSLGVGVYVYTKGSAAGSLVIELQKYIGGSWLTQRSATVPWSGLYTGWNNSIAWSAGTGDDHLTPDANTWRFRFTSTTSDGSLKTSDGSQVTCYGLFWPDGWPTEDFNGLPRHQGDYLVMPGPFQPQIEELDWTVYHTNAPSLKLSRRSSSIFTIAANRDVPLTVKVQVKHVNTAGDKPAVRLRGLDITEQVAVCTAPDDTWQELTVQATPSLPGVLQVVFEARDPAEGAAAYFEVSEVS